ncbi:hypothetical protein GJ496_000073 [Pomphorhynchus laevis]|nr:hypothetical protein GJ496_000073 [Pomphorhynchus laevis]
MDEAMTSIRAHTDDEFSPAQLPQKTMFPATNIDLADNKLRHNSGQQKLKEHDSSSSTCSSSLFAKKDYSAFNNRSSNLNPKSKNDDSKQRINDCNFDPNLFPIEKNATTFPVTNCSRKFKRVSGRKAHKPERNYNSVVLIENLQCESNTANDNFQGNERHEGVHIESTHLTSSRSTNDEVSGSVSNFNVNVNHIRKKQMRKRSNTEMGGVQHSDQTMEINEADGTIPPLLSNIKLGSKCAPFSRITTGIIGIDDCCSSNNELFYTFLQGVRIACFRLGGEKRLCLQDIMCTVLKHIPVASIEHACNYLNIYTQPCSPVQVYFLQVNRIIPIGTTCCSLITQTNAERLCHHLLFQGNDDLNEKTATLTAKLDKSVDVQCIGICCVEQQGHKFSQTSPLRLGESSDRKECEIPYNPSSTKSQYSTSKLNLKNEGSHNIHHLKYTSGSAIPVIHNCSGCVRGIVFTPLYINPKSKCILCKKCSMIFSPPDFVCHDHKLYNKINRTENITHAYSANAGPPVCHWGLDSSKWRLYLNVDKTVINEDSQLKSNDIFGKRLILFWEEKLNMMKQMFCCSLSSTTTSRSNVTTCDKPKSSVNKPPDEKKCKFPLLPINNPIVPSYFEGHKVNVDTCVNTNQALPNQVSNDRLATIRIPNSSLTNPGSVAIEIGFDSLVRRARQLLDEAHRTDIVNDILKLHMLCQHSMSFLFQTNSLLSHSIDQLARENIQLKREYESLLLENKRPKKMTSSSDDGSLNTSLSSNDIHLCKESVVNKQKRNYENG